MQENTPHASHGDTKQVPQAITSGSKQNGSNQSSKLSRVLRSLSAPEQSLSSEAQMVQKDQCISSQHTSSSNECFNPISDPEGHFYSAKHLFARGVWIGYLAPDRQSKSFGGLPSFSKLKRNFSMFITPYPPVIEGAVGQTRHGVCRECATSNSVLIELREVKFWGKSKLVIMPLDGDDELGVFAIMVPQKRDRSLNGLLSYRLYEITKKGSDEAFTNNYFVLANRNPQKSDELLATALKVLPTQKRAHTNVAKYSAGDTIHACRSWMLPKTTAIRTSAEEVKIAEDGLRNKQTSPRKRRKVSIVIPHKLDNTEDDYKGVGGGCVGLDTGHVSGASFFSSNPSRVARHQPPLESTSLRLTDEQADRIYISWSVKDRGTEYEFVNTVGECKTFAGLLDILKEDTEVIPAIAETLKGTKIWCLSYCLGDGTSKALVTRKESEVAFDQLQIAFAQAPVWSTDLTGRVRVELKSLSRPDSACTV